MTTTDAILTQNAFLIRQFETLTAQLTDAHLIEAPVAGGKSPGWLMGHLAVTADGGRTMSGLARRCPREWWHLFGPGTSPATSPTAYPPIHTLRSEVIAINAELHDVFPALSSSVLATPTPYAPAAVAFPTIGEFVCYMLTGHLSYHLGQLTLACGSALE